MFYLIIGIIIALLLALFAYTMKLMEKKAEKERELDYLKEAKRRGQQIAKDNAKYATDDINTVRKRLHEFTKN